MSVVALYNAAFCVANHLHSVPSCVLRQVVGLLSGSMLAQERFQGEAVGGFKAIKG